MYFISSWFACTLVAPTIYHLITGIWPCTGLHPAVSSTESCSHYWTQWLYSLLAYWLNPDSFSFYLHVLLFTAYIPIKWSCASCYYKNREVITTCDPIMTSGRKKNALLSHFEAYVSQLKCFSDLAVCWHCLENFKKIALLVPPQKLSFSGCGLWAEHNVSKTPRWF